jgi:hypothetical protein
MCKYMYRIAVVTAAWPPSTGKMWPVIQCPMSLPVSSQELAMAVSLLSDRPGSLLICNGYKDAAYMESVRLVDVP